MNVFRNSLTTAALVIMLLGSNCCSGSVLESHINPTNNHIYHLLNVATWTTSEEQARTLGGHLASIGSQIEQDWIWQTFGVGRSRHLWVGLNDVALEGTFVWSSGEPLTYTNWTPYEPNNGSGIGMLGTEHWVHLDGFRNGEWNDMNQFNPGNVVLPVYAVVEVVPEPGGLSFAIAGAATLLSPLIQQLRRGLSIKKFAATSLTFRIKKNHFGHGG